MNTSTISEHIYNDTVSQAIQFVEKIDDEETLFVYAFNYNWDNGFDIPTAILNNKHCSLSIALMIFLASDGILFLQEREAADGTKSWMSFIKNLYKRILSNDFSHGATSFEPQLSKVQEYKLKKVLDEPELVFITPIEGVDCYQSI